MGVERGHPGEFHPTRLAGSPHQRPPDQPCQQSVEPGPQATVVGRPGGSRGRAKRTLQDQKPSGLKVEDHHAGRVRVERVDDKPGFLEAGPRSFAEPPDHDHLAVITLTVHEPLVAKIVVERDLVPRLYQSLDVVGSGRHPECSRVGRQESLTRLRLRPTRRVTIDDVHSE
jgi:hypothetical protein